MITTCEIDCSRNVITHIYWKIRKSYKCNMIKDINDNNDKMTINFQSHNFLKFDGHTLYFLDATWIDNVLQY